MKYLKRVIGKKSCHRVPKVVIDQLFNPQALDGVYKPPHVCCRMGFLNTLPFPALHLSRNAAIMPEPLKIVRQNDTEPYSFVNNRLRASKPSFCHLSPPSLPYTLPIFRWLPVHVRWKRKGNNCILCFFTSFLTISKRKKIFIFIFKLAEISPEVG